MTDIETDLKYIRRDLDSIMKKLDSNYVTKSEFTVVESNVKKLEDNLTWFVRLVISFIVLAVLGLVVTTV